MIFSAPENSHERRQAESPNFGGSIEDWLPSGLRSQMQYDQLPQVPVLRLPTVKDSTQTVGHNGPLIL